MKAPAFQWYPKDCDTDENVRLMDDREFGFYVRCLNHSWMNRGLPEDLCDLAKILGRTPQYVKSIWKRVGQCFILQDGRYVNPRQEKQRNEQAQLSNVNSRNASARWSQCGRNAVASNPHPDRNALQSASTTASPSTSSSEAEIIRQSLRKYMGGVVQTDPDDRIVDEVYAEGCGASAEEINNYLCTMWETHQPGTRTGPRSYGWFPVVVKAHFSRRRTQ